MFLHACSPIPYLTCCTLSHGVRVCMVPGVARQVQSSCEDPMWVAGLKEEAVARLKAAPPLAELHAFTLWHQVSVS
jgi:hypothetical protein